MYSNQYTQQYPQYNQQYQQYPPNYYQVYNYNQQPAYNAPQPTQTATTFVSQNVPVPQPQVSSPGQNVSSLWMGSVCIVQLFVLFICLTVIYRFYSWNLT